MDEDEYADYELEDEYGNYELDDDSYAAPNSSWNGAGAHFAHAPFAPAIAPGLAPAWTPPPGLPPPPAFPPPAVIAGSTWEPPGTPNHHAAFDMPHIPPEPTMYNGHPQMAADGAPGHGFWSWPQPAGYPGAESGFAHQPWEQGQIQTHGGKKRKNKETCHGQKRIKSGGAASHAQQGSAQPATLAWGGNDRLGAAANAMQGSTEALAWGGNAKLGAVANAMQGSTEALAWGGNAELEAVANAKRNCKETLVCRRDSLLDAAANAMQISTAVGTDGAEAATAGGEAKQAAGLTAAGPSAAGPSAAGQTAAAQGEPSANVDSFARSSFGNAPVQAAARRNGVQSTYKFSSLF